MEREICLIHTALHWEAAPLIRRLSLKKDVSFGGSIELYRGEGIWLVVSGIGKLKSAIALTRVLSSLKDPSSIFAINFGLAGAANSDRPIGAMFLANKIVDAASTKHYYPDLFLHSGISETSIETHDRGVREESRNLIKSDLVDMEAAGFYEAALAFLPPHHIVCLKIVSDHLACAGLSKESVADFIEPHLDSVQNLINSYLSLLKENHPGFSAADEEILTGLTRKMRFTESQKLILENEAMGYIARGAENLSVLDAYLLNSPETKAQGKELFSEIRNALSST